MSKTKLVAILSTTVIPNDGVYRVTRIEGMPPQHAIQGVPHYIGHPDTKAIIEELGATPAESKLFQGLQEGESCLCIAIKQGRSSRATDGFTTPHQSITLDDLDIRVLTRGVESPQIPLPQVRIL